MDRAELTLAIAAALGLAVALGWLLGAIARRLNARPASRTSPDNSLVAAERERAERVEADLRARLAMAEAGRAEALALLDVERAAAAELLAAMRDVREPRS